MFIEYPKGSTLFFILIVSLLFSCKGDKHIYWEEKGSVFNTSYTIKYRYTKSLKNEIEKRFSQFDDSLNPFKDSSIISKVNNNEEVVLDSLFIRVFNRSVEVSEVSGGLFDITISPLINAWGFGYENIENMGQSTIDSLMQFVGYKKVKIEGDRIVKMDDRSNLNMSAIAKGYSSDVIALLLGSYGIEDYMVEVGGEISVRGHNQKGKCWQIAVKKPPLKNNQQYQENQLILDLCNKSLATSGNYYKYFVKDGKKYAHTIDPRIGQPVRNEILSATVIAEDCMTADAFATVFMLADTAEIRRIATQENLSYMLVLGTDVDYHLVKSIGFDSFISGY